MSKTTFVSTIYVDQLNGDDFYNNGSQKSPFKSLQKAVDTVPDFESADIHILGDYTLKSNVNIFRKTKVTLILHGTLTTIEYDIKNSPSVQYPDYTGIYYIMVANSKLHVIIDSDNNGKIVVPPELSWRLAAPDQSTMFCGSEYFDFTDITFDLRVKQDDYNPIIVNSGFGLVSIDSYYNKNVKLNVKIIGSYPGKNRNIIVDSRSFLVSFDNTNNGGFYYDYPGGILTQNNLSFSAGCCVVGDYVLLQ